MKTVYNVINGAPTIAQEDPIDGGWILPKDTVETAPPDFNPETHNCIYSFETGEWVTSLIPVTEEEPNDIDADMLLRVTRNSLLEKSDYRLLADYTGTDVAAWKTYRQALRDVPQNNPSPTWNSETGELENVNWPTPPST
jgi:hypothetical protein